LLTERRDDSCDTGPPLLSAHPWRLPVLLVLAFAATIAIAGAVLRQKPHAAPAQVSQSHQR
jgi:hypothetical protein